MLMTRYAVLVCGGRTYRNRPYVFTVLNALHEKLGPLKIIEGGADGADSLAREWAIDAKVPVTTFPAHWRELGKKAGVLRNTQMLQEGQPQLVVAFPGGKGTADMVRKARAANVEVILCDEGAQVPSPSAVTT